VPVVIEDQELVSVPKAARLLDLPGNEVYMLIFRGELEARPTLERGVLVPLPAIEQWLRDHPHAAHP
jgi:hypothetical protein